jgi:hypothetical protein
MGGLALALVAASGLAQGGRIAHHIQDIIGI